MTIEQAITQVLNDKKDLLLKMKNANIGSFLSLDDTIQKWNTLLILEHGLELSMPDRYQETTIENALKNIYSDKETLAKILILLGQDKLLFYIENIIKPLKNWTIIKSPKVTWDYQYGYSLRRYWSNDDDLIFASERIMGGDLADACSITVEGASDSIYVTLQINTNGNPVVIKGPHNSNRLCNSWESLTITEDGKYTFSFTADNLDDYYNFILIKGPGLEVVHPSSKVVITALEPYSQKIEKGLDGYTQKTEVEITYAVMGHNLDFLREPDDYTTNESCYIVPKYNNTRANLEVEINELYRYWGLFNIFTIKYSSDLGCVLENECIDLTFDSACEGSLENNRGSNYVWDKTEFVLDSISMIFYDLYARFNDTELNCLNYIKIVEQGECTLTFEVEAKYISTCPANNIEIQSNTYNVIKKITLISTETNLKDELDELGLTTITTYKYQCLINNTVKTPSLDEIKIRLSNGDSKYDIKLYVIGKGRTSNDNCAYFCPKDNVILYEERFIEDNGIYSSPGRPGQGEGLVAESLPIYVTANTTLAFRIDNAPDRRVVASFSPIDLRWKEDIPNLMQDITNNSNFRSENKVLWWSYSTNNSWELYEVTEEGLYYFLPLKTETYPGLTFKAKKV